MVVLSNTVLNPAHPNHTRAPESHTRSTENTAGGTVKEGTVIMRRLKGSLFRANRFGVVGVVGTCALIIWLGTSVQIARAQQTTAGTTPNTVKPAEIAPPAASSQASGLYRIGPGDVLDIRVFDYPQLSRDAVRVDGRGVIRMPLIEDEFQAACRTEAELAKEIATRYLKYQKNPHVDVFVKEYNSQPVAVIGAVDKPGRFQIQRPVRLLELISLAGGPTDKAGKRIQIAHTGGVPTCNATGMVSAGEDALEDFDTYNLNDTQLGDSKSNPYVRPGDIVTIPEAEQVFVVGNVFRPSIIPLKETVTVSQAIAMAGGMLPDTKIDRVRIIRKMPGATDKSEIFVNLQAISQRRAEDAVLQSGDIVDVPVSAGKKLLRSIVSTLVPAVGNLPIYVVR